MLVQLKVKLNRTCRARDRVFLAGREVTVEDRELGGSYFLQLEEGDYLQIDKRAADVVSVLRASSRPPA